MPDNIKRVPVKSEQEWSIGGPAFQGPREDVLAAVAGLQTVPDEYAAALMQSLKALPATVRGVALDVHHTAYRDGFMLNAHCRKLF